MKGDRVLKKNGYFTIKFKKYSKLFLSFGLIFYVYFQYWIVLFSVRTLLDGGKSKGQVMILSAAVLVCSLLFLLVVLALINKKRVNRVTVFKISFFVSIFSAIVMTHFSSLYWLIVPLVISLFISQPLLFSINGDLFTEKDRFSVAAVFFMANMLGAIRALAYSYNGLENILQNRSIWVLHTVAFFCLIFFHFFVSEPVPASTEKVIKKLDINEVKEEDYSSKKLKLFNFKSLIIKPSNVHVCMQHLFLAFSFIVLLFNLPAIMSNLHHLNASESWAILIAFISGPVIGGSLSFLFRIWYKKYRILSTAAFLCSITGFILVCFLLFGKISSVSILVLFAFFSGMLVAAPLSISKGMLLNINMAECRVPLAALFLIFQSAGMGLGFVLIRWLPLEYRSITAVIGYGCASLMMLFLIITSTVDRIKFLKEMHSIAGQLKSKFMPVLVKKMRKEEKFIKK